KVACEIPAGAHPRIVYAAGVVASSSSETASAFVDFLAGETARRLWSQTGFLPPGASALFVPDPYSALRLSLVVGAWCVVLGLPIAIFFGYLLARRSFPGKTVLS